MKSIYLGNDNTLEVSGLRNADTGAYENAATMSATVTNIACTNVTGQTWPTSLTYVPASNGVYRATLQDTLVLNAGDVYQVIITGIASGSAFKSVTSVLAAERRS